MYQISKDTVQGIIIVLNIALMFWNPARLLIHTEAEPLRDHPTPLHCPRKRLACHSIHLIIRIDISPFHKYFITLFTPRSLLVIPIAFGHLDMQKHPKTFSVCIPFYSNLRRICFNRSLALLQWRQISR